MQRSGFKSQYMPVYLCMDLQSCDRHHVSLVRGSIQLKFELKRPHWKTKILYSFSLQGAGYYDKLCCFLCIYRSLHESKWMVACCYFRVNKGQIFSFGSWFGLMLWSIIYCQILFLLFFQSLLEGCFLLILVCFHGFMVNHENKTFQRCCSI